MNGFVDSDKARENRARRVEKLRQGRNRIETQSAFAVRKRKVRQTCVRPTVSADATKFGNQSHTLNQGRTGFVSFTAFLTKNSLFDRCPQNLIKLIFLFNLFYFSEEVVENESETNITNSVNVEEQTTESFTSKSMKKSL